MSTISDTELTGLLIVIIGYWIFLIVFGLCIKNEEEKEQKFQKSWRDY